MKKMIVAFLVLPILQSAKVVSAQDTTKSDSIVVLQEIVKTVVGVPQELKRTPYGVSISSSLSTSYQSTSSQSGIIVSGVDYQTKFVSIQGTRSLFGDNTPYYQVYGLSFRPLYLNNLGVSQPQMLPFIGSSIVSTFVGSGSVLLGYQAVNGVVDFEPMIPDTGIHIYSNTEFVYEQHGLTMPRQSKYQSAGPGQPGGLGEPYLNQVNPSTISDFFRNGQSYSQELSFSQRDSINYFKSGFKANKNQFVVPNSSSIDVAGYILAEKKLFKKLRTRPIVSINLYQGNNLPQTGYSKENVLFWNVFAPADADFKSIYWYDSLGNKGIDSPDWLTKHFNTKLQSSFLLAGIENEFKILPSISILHHSGAGLQYLNMQTKRDGGGAGKSYNKNVESSANDIHHDISFNWIPDVFLSPQVILGARINRSIWTIDQWQTQENKTLKTLPYSSPSGDQGLFVLTNLKFKRLAIEMGLANDWTSALAKENSSLLSWSGGLSYVLKRSARLPFQKIYMSMYHTPSAMIPKEWLISSYYTSQEVDGQTIYSLSSTKGNPDLKSQVTEGTELGWNGWFGKQAWLKLNFVVYSHNTTNQIMPVRISGFDGYQYEIQNAGTIQNNGVLFGGAIVPVKTKNLKLEFFGSWSKEKQILTEIGNGSDYIVTYQSGVGPSIGYIQGFDGPRLIGTWNAYTDGHPTQDINGVYKTIFGGNWNINPDYRYQFGLNTSYKKFFLSVLFDGQKGGNYWTMDEAMMHYMSTHKDLESNGNIAYHQQYLYNHELSIYDASYLDFKRLELGYNFKKLILSGFVKNLCTWGLSNQYYHPQTMIQNAYATPSYQMGSLPLSRYYGINLKINI